MLPDWDFGNDDRKRREFITWVWTELDRFALMASARYEMPPDRRDWDEVLKPGLFKSARGAGRPPEAFVGMNAMVWEFGLLRYMFNRYWPQRRRGIAHPASAASIAVERCQRALPRDQRTNDRLAPRAELALRVYEEWERGSRSHGRKQAEADIAFLKGLPDSRFAK